MPRIVNVMNCLVGFIEGAESLPGIPAAANHFDSSGSASDFDNFDSGSIFYFF